MVVVEERRGKKDLKYFEGYALEKTTLMRYSYQMHSVPVVGQWPDYFGEQGRFALHSPKWLQKWSNGLKIYLKLNT